MIADHPRKTSSSGLPKLRRTVSWLLLTLACQAAVVTGARAAEILDYLPEDALGFVVVRNLSETSERVQDLAKTANIPAPSLLQFMKFSTGLTAGLDEQGDLLVALIPGPRRQDPPEPMVLLPVADYARLAAAVQGDESGAPCRIQISGEDVLIAKQGPFAMIMNLEHRESLELILGLESAPVEFLRPWNEWLHKNQATAVVMPEGVNWLLESGMQTLTTDPSTQGDLLGELFGGPEMAGLLGQLREALPVYAKVLELVSSEIQAVGVGVEIDSETNVRLGKRLILSVDHAEKQQSAERDLLLGFTEQPFVFAGGIALPESILEKLVEYSFQIQRSAPNLWDLEDLPDEMWPKHQDAVAAVAGGIKSVSLMMLPGEEGDPLLSNFYGVLQVDSAADFLEAYEQEVEVRNEVLAHSQGDIQMVYDVRRLRIADGEALEEVVDVATAAEDPAVPQFNWFLDAMFGEEGKLRTYWVAADEKLIVFGLADEKEMKLAVERVRRGDRTLEVSAAVATTKALLPAQAAGRFYVSPQGCSTWVKRVLTELVGPIFGNGAPDFDLPATPPIGIWYDFPQQQMVVELVWPAEVTRRLANPPKQRPAQL